MGAYVRQIELESVPAASQATHRVGRAIVVHAAAVESETRLVARLPPSTINIGPVNVQRQRGRVGSSHNDTRVLHA